MQSIQGSSFYFTRPYSSFVLSALLSGAALTAFSPLALAASTEIAASVADFSPPSATLDQQLSASLTKKEEACQLDYLKSLGWRIIESKSGAVEVIDGNPCNRDSISDSQASGELTIALPPNPTPKDLSDVSRILGELTTTNATVCAYKLKVAIAAKKAINQLKANSKNYRFAITSFGSGLRQLHYPTGFVDLGILGGRRMGWEQLDGVSDGLAYMPRGSSWDAIESFYHKEARSECAAGLQLAEYAVQKELYGKDDFDIAFMRDEIVIGAWSLVGASNSATTGKHSGRVVGDRDGEQAAIMGGKSLVGRTGYFGNVFGEEFLDDKPNRGENLIVASITPAASLELGRAGSVDKFNKLLRQAWDLRSANSKMDPEKDAAKIAANELEIKMIKANPFLSGVKTHTHPYNRYYSYSQLFEILWKANPRTPYEISFYDDVVNYGLYDRYLNYNINKCLRTAR